MNRFDITNNILLLFCMFATLDSSAAFAQETKNDGVNFKEQEPLAEIIATAKAKNMNVLIDCYTTWCGPCKHMSSVEFPKKIMGDYFNANFLNYKEDMEKTTGLTIAKKFNIRAYPTFLILDSFGNEISRLVGSMSAEEFISKVKNAIETGGLSGMRARFEKGGYPESFLFDYLEGLSDANLKADCSKVAQIILTGKESKILTDEKYRDVFMDYIDLPEDPIFQYALTHKDSLAKTLKEGQLQNKFDACWLSYSENFYSKKDSTKANFDAHMKEYAKLMDKFGVTNKEELLNRCYLSFSIFSHNWNDCIVRAEKEVHSSTPDLNSMYSFFYNVALKCRDASIKKQTNHILQAQLVNYQQKEAAALENSEQKKEYSSIVRAFRWIAEKLTDINAK